MTTINDEEEQHSRITKLIRLGKEQNYLIQADINDLLPNIVDTEHFEVIISMLESMNIKVYEKPPSADELALLGTTEEIPEDIEEAASVLESVDKETGRTTDPVRMYMREMGTVELLTREGEIKIAKRIEEGIYQVLRALANYPETIHILLNDFERVLIEEIRLSEIISGFVDAEDEAPATNIGSMLDESQQDGLIDEEPALVVAETEDEDGIVEVDEGPSIEQAQGYFDEIKEHYETAKTLMKDGVMLWIAPEGTRSSNGKLGPFKKGAFITAIQAQAIIIPIGIRGAHEVLPARTFRYGTHQKVEVHIGAPIDASLYTIETRDELIQRTHTVMKELVGQTDHFH